jgi:hypothetical protein
MITWKDKVVSILKLHPIGLSVSEISRQLATTRITAALALAELKGEGKVSIRMVGVAKLHCLKL